MAKKNPPKKKAKSKRPKKTAKKPAKRPPVKRSKKPVKKPLKKVEFSSYWIIRTVLDIALKFTISEKHPDVPKLDLNKNLDYTEGRRAILELRMDKYVKSINKKASFTPEDMDACDTVQDVVDKVKGKLDQANEKV